MYRAGQGPSWLEGGSGEGSFTFPKGNFALAGKFPRFTFTGLNYDHFYSLNLSDDLDGLGLGL